MVQVLLIQDVNLKIIAQNDYQLNKVRYRHAPPRVTLLDPERGMRR